MTDDQWHTIIGNAESGVNATDIRGAIVMLMKLTNRSAAQAGTEVRNIIGILNARGSISAKSIVPPLREIRSSVEQCETTGAKFEYLRQTFGTENAQAALFLAANVERLHQFAT